MDRSIAPPISQIEHIRLPNVSQETLSSGIKVFYVIDDSVDAFKIEAISKSGFLQSKSAAESVLCTKMLSEGTSSFPRQNLIEHVDNLGSFLEVTPSFDFSTTTLFGLSRFFNENIEILHSVLFEASFDASQLDKLKARELDRIKLNREKASYLASINLRNVLFGEHPYGYQLKPSDVNNITRDDLVRFYEAKMQSFDLFLSGKLPDDFIQQLEVLFTVRKAPEQAVNLELHIPQTDNIIRSEKYIQSAIRLGKVLFNRKDPDYLDFLVLNELFGGYFGSRLMKNIREDKGYTYGISSHLYALQETGYFTIGTDVNFEAEADTLVQIEKEIELLQTQLVPAQELATVKNYLLGSFTNSLSTPFASIDKFKALYNQGYDLSFYDRYVDSIKSVSAARILALAQAHLSWDSFSHSIVGK